MTRPRRRAWPLFGGAGLAGALAASMQASAAGAAAQEAAEDAAMQAVCGRCHDLQLVTPRVRSEDEWITIFHKMVELGAKGTDEQFDAVGRYIQTRLTLVFVNEAPAEELARLLDVPDSVAVAIVARRGRQRFRDLADLATVPGLDLAAISRRQDRIVF